MISEICRERVLLIGNLYTENGIQYIVKNSLLCPQIYGFILIGNDKNRVRETLLSKDYYYARDDNFKRFYDTFIASGRMYDCVMDDDNYMMNFDRLIPMIVRERSTPNWITEPIDCYSEELTQTDSHSLITLPSEHQGFHVRDTSLKRLWHKVLALIKRFGIERTTSTGKRYREILGLVSVLEALDESSNGSINTPVKMPEYAPLSSTIEAYSAQIITDSPQQGIEYTYGQRLHQYGQIDAIIDKLKADKANRQAIGVTWNLPKDSTSPYPPCCVLADFKVQPRSINGTTVDALYLTLYFRSHDIYSAYCANIYGFRRLQEMIAAFTDCVPGYIMIVSNSAHVYDYDYPQALIYDELGCRMDPRGYFIIETVKDDDAIDCWKMMKTWGDQREFEHKYGERARRVMNTSGYTLYNEPQCCPKIIKLTYMSPSDQPIASTTGLDVQQLCDFAMPYISEISHAMYLGRELQRARNCIDKCEPYEQP